MPGLNCPIAKYGLNTVVRTQSRCKYKNEIYYAFFNVPCYYLGGGGLDIFNTQIRFFHPKTIF